MSKSNEISYIGYQEMIADITMALEKTGDVMKALDLTERSSQTKELSNRVKSHVFSVGILGEFKRGKSTVINALLGEEIAPANVKPATATLNCITYGLTPKATIVYNDGHRTEVPVNEIANYVTKINDETAKTAETVEEAIVEYPCQFCKNNVEIIDTPGLNDDERMTRITESVIPRLDAVVMVLSALSPFSLSEADFVRNKLMTSDVSRMIVLVNRIDNIYSESDRQSVLKVIKEKIVKELLERTAAIHGKNSKLYKDTEEKLAGIQIYPLSAIKALIGRKENKPELIEESGILAFEERLRKMLTEERGVMEITRVSNMINSMVIEGTGAIAARIESLNMEAEEFEKNKIQAEAEIMELRESKKNELENIRNVADEIKAQMKILLDDKYAELKNRINNFLDDYLITASDLKNNNTKTELQEKINEGVKQEIISAMSEYTEQINVFLREKIGDENVRIQEYMGDFAKKYIQIGERISNKGAAMTAGVIGIDAISNLLAATSIGVFSGAGFGLFGLGGLIEGYKTNGVKGAVTGVAGGFAASAATATCMLAVMGSVPFLPFAIATGIAGTMCGKLITSMIWRKDISENKIKDIRDALKKSVDPMIRDLKEQRLLENWAEKQVNEQINILTDHVEKETEVMISNTEVTLKNIAADISASGKEKEKRLEKYKNLEKELNNVNEILKPIMEKVSLAVENISQQEG